MKKYSIFAFIVLFTLCFASCKGPISKLEESTNAFVEANTHAMQQLSDKTGAAEDLADEAACVAVYKQELENYHQLMDKQEAEWQESFKSACRWKHIDTNDLAKIEKNERLAEYKKMHDNNVAAFAKELAAIESDYQNHILNMADVTSDATTAATVVDANGEDVESLDAEEAEEQGTSNVVVDYNEDDDFSDFFGE